MATHAEQQRPPHQHPSPSHTLPSITSLTNGLPGAGYSPTNRAPTSAPSRDSGTWPYPQNTQNSSVNSQNLQVSTLLNPEEGQPRNSVPSTPTSSRLSQQQQQQQQPGNAMLPSINQSFESTKSAQRQSTDYYNAIDSRRSSIDSRMHTNFSNLGLNNNNNNPTSPYDSQNTSQVSLAASLRRPNGQAPMSPLSGRNSLRGSHHPPRIAPPIVPNARVPGAPDPMAAKPTQGFPWAFPDSAIPEEQQRRGSSSDDSSIRRSVSRQNSFAASSIRSSIFSTDSALPAGQRRFDDDAQTTHHHHQLQHRSIASLQNNDAASASGNYSRTPELRVSHKLAERKRRSEMKDLFEELNRAVPANGGAKASKWEILTKAIEYIRTNQMQERNLHGEMTRLRADADFARESLKENDSLRTEIQVMHERLRRLDPAGQHIYGQYTSRLAQQQTQQQSNGAHPAPYALPPMNSAPPPPQHQQPPQHYGQIQPPPGAMQGVEYGASQRSSYEMR
ncbi:hypothetical protein AAFC00_007294 [Neodothiora populina]|uniref:BHLH domain-containing protein n=1 Tax=Neodothiora populina TaxID=2781224 RepID=A0ABR3PI51_9PEZI